MSTDPCAEGQADQVEEADYGDEEVGGVAWTVLKPFWKPVNQSGVDSGHCGYLKQSN